jgi:hypothetical protein
MVDALDASLYAGREDRQIVLMDGGVFTFVVDPLTGLGTLTWASTINISAPITGFTWFITAGSLALLEGEVFYVNIPRAPLTNVGVTARQASQVPSSDADLLIGIRRGDRFYFRNGRGIATGETISVLEVSSGGVSGGSPDFKSPCRFATTGPVTLVGGAPSTIGAAPLVVDDRILVWQQAAPAENGIYSVQTVGTGADGTWVRTTDANTSPLVKAGFVVVVAEGAAADKMFELTTNNPITLDVTPLAFAVVNTFGTTGQKIRSNIPIALYAATNLGPGLQAIGNYGFATTPATEYAITGTTVTTVFKVTASITAPATGQVLLYNLTTPGTVAGSTMTITSAIPSEQTAVVTLNVNPTQMYEVRFGVTSTPGIPGTLICAWAGLEILNTF